MRVYLLFGLDALFNTFEAVEGNGANSVKYKLEKIHWQAGSIFNQFPKHL